MRQSVCSSGLQSAFFPFQIEIHSFLYFSAAAVALVNLANWIALLHSVCRIYRADNLSYLATRKLLGPAAAAAIVSDCMHELQCLPTCSILFSWLINYSTVTAAAASAEAIVIGVLASSLPVLYFFHSIILSLYYYYSVFVSVARTSKVCQPVWPVCPQSVPLLCESVTDISFFVCPSFIHCQLDTRTLITTAPTSFSFSFSSTSATDNTKTICAFPLSCTFSTFYLSSSSSSALDRILFSFSPKHIFSFLLLSLSHNHLTDDLVDEQHQQQFRAVLATALFEMVIFVAGTNKFSSK